jgi:predicted ATPase
LHASLLSRLDRLGAAKEAVEIAAAIGREFSHGLLAAVARLPEAALESQLDRALLAGLILRQGVPPHASYRFKHALIQEAAYGTLLRGKREALHARIAEVYERQFPEIAEAQPALLAHHLALAGLGERAVGFWLKAARKAIGTGAIAEAVTQLRRALLLVDDLGDQSVRRRLEVELQIALGNALMALRGYSAPETDAAFRRARELCTEAEDGPQLLRVLWGQYTGNFAGGRERGALDVAEELLGLSQQLGDDAGRQLGHASVGATLLHLGSLSRARPHFDQALAAGAGYEREWAFRYGQSGKVVAHSYLSIDLLLLGFPDQGRSHAEQAVAEAQRLTHPPSLCFAHSIVCRFYYLLGDASRAGEHAGVVARLADEQRLGLWQGLGSIYVGWNRAAMGATDEARSMIREGLAKYWSVGAGLGLPLYLSSLARLEAQSGNYQEAMRLIEEAAAVLKNGEEGWLCAELHRVSAEIILMDPDRDRTKAEMHLAHALSVADGQDASFWKLRAALAMAHLWKAEGKRQQAFELLAPVCSWFTEGLTAPDLKQARDLLRAIWS